MAKHPLHNVHHPIDKHLLDTFFAHEEALKQEQYKILEEGNFSEEKSKTEKNVPHLMYPIAEAKADITNISSPALHKELFAWDDEIVSLYHSGRTQDFLQLIQQLFVQHPLSHLIAILGNERIISYLDIICSLLIARDDWGGYPRIEKIVSSYLPRFSRHYKELYRDQYYRISIWMMERFFHYNNFSGVLSICKQCLSSQDVMYLSAEQHAIILQHKILALQSLHRYDEALDEILSFQKSSSLQEYFLDNNSFMQFILHTQQVILEKKIRSLMSNAYYSQIWPYIDQLLACGNSSFPLIQEISRYITDHRQGPQFIENKDFLTFAGKFFFSQGMYKKSKDFFMRLLDLDPENQEAIDYLWHQFPHRY